MTSREKPLRSMEDNRFDQMRWIQITLAENDPGRFDPDWWLDFCRNAHVDGASYSAGGYIAYYPTKIPYHYKSKWLGDTDPFGYLVEESRKLGMTVLGRSDSHAIHQDAFEAHPEWVAVDEEGNPKKHMSAPGVWLTCPLGSYNFEFMTEVHKEIVSLYMVDGIYSNRWTGSAGVCYCKNCQRNFRATSGMNIPRTKDPSEPAWKKYIFWRQEILFEIQHLWDGVIKGVNPNAHFIPNSGGGALSELDMQRLCEPVPFLYVDRQGRRGLVPPWDNGKNAKEFRAALGKKPIVSVYSCGLEEKYRWKDSTQSNAEIRTWMVEAIANGMKLRLTKFSGMVYDDRWVDVITDVYNWTHLKEKYLQNEDPLAQVGLVYSQQTAKLYGGEKAEKKVEDHIRGFYHALIEARIPFEMVQDNLLNEDRTKRFDTLILPNIAVLSDAQCDYLRQFVINGGSIIATHETSLYDELGNKRSNFGLADLLGVDVKGEIEGPMKNAYLNVEHNSETGKTHPVLKGLETAKRLINGVYRIPVDANTTFADKLITYVPPYPDLPMEEVYPRIPRTDKPELYIREVGAGRVAYFPWDIDRTFWEILNVDHGVLLANATRWAINKEPIVSVIGPGIIDVVPWIQKKSMTIHLVNLTNPMFMKGPIREIIPIGEQKVRILLPKGKRAKKVQLLRHDDIPDSTVTEEYVELTISSIGDFEVVAIDFED